MKFSEHVYKLCKQVPKGKVTTYKAIGDAIGSGGMVYRAVGQALNKNPYAPIVPCHRVVSSSGKLGGFAFGSEKKIKMLKAEGIEVKEGKVVNFKEKFYKIN